MCWTSGPIPGWAALLLVTGTLALAVPTGGQSQGTRDATRGDSTASVSGSVVDSAAGRPVAYATVLLLPGNRETFTDDSGAFRLGTVLSGTYRIRARQIGYAAADTTITVATGAALRLSLRLHRIPLVLPQVSVQSRRSNGCVATGPPDSAANPQLFTIFAQVRANVDRFRLLVDEYPFRYAREEGRLIRSSPGDDSTLGVDTAAYESTAHGSYRQGGVIYNDVDARGRRTQYMYLPTFRDFADSAFLAAHCFTFEGTQHSWR